MLQHINNHDVQLQAKDNIQTLMSDGHNLFVKGQHLESANKLHEATTLAYKLFKKERSLKNKKCLYSAIIKNGEITYETGQFSKSLSIFNVGRDLIEKIYNEDTSLPTLVNVAHSQKWVGKAALKEREFSNSKGALRMSIQHFDNIHKISKSNSSLCDLSFAYSELAKLYSIFDDRKQAISFYKKSYSTLKPILNKISHNAQAHFYDDYGMSALLLEDLGNAKNAYDKSLELKEIIYKNDKQYNHLRELARGWSNLGAVAYQISDKDQALNAYTESLKIRQYVASKINTPSILRDLTLSHYKISNILSDLVFLKQAKEHLEKSIKCAQLFLVRTSNSIEAEELLKHVKK